MATVSKEKLKLQRLNKINVSLVGLIIICNTMNIFVHSLLPIIDFIFSLRNKLKVIPCFCTVQRNVNGIFWLR